MVGVGFVGIGVGEFVEVVFVLVEVVLNEYVFSVRVSVIMMIRIG